MFRKIVFDGIKYEKEKLCNDSGSIIGLVFLDMIGVRFGEKYLVTRSYAEDGIYFIIYLIALLLFIFKEQIGKWAVTAWLIIWLITQFLSHEWYTIFNHGLMGGSANGVIKFFSDTIHWLDIEGIYIPDLYHTILHLLILSALIATILYIQKSKKKRYRYLTRAYTV